jgi:hypothetical protein
MAPPANGADGIQRFTAKSGEQVGGNVKGAAFREVIIWLEKHVGHDALLPGYERLLPQHQEMLDPRAPAMGIVSSYWYPYVVAVELMQAAVDARPPEERNNLIRESVRYSMDRTFKGIYRMLFQLMVNPSRAARYIQRMWDLHYDNGKVTWVVIHQGEMRAEMRDWAGHTADGCEMLRQIEMYFLELMGCEGVDSVRTTCVARGEPSCASIVTWKP